MADKVGAEMEAPQKGLAVAQVPKSPQVSVMARSQLRLWQQSMLLAVDRHRTLLTP
jgi:hypothetical protein